jgi:thiosulfate/3-mercaptopyruvate sulfurtransferase
VKDLAWLAQQDVNQVALLDARDPEEYSGYKSGRGILRGGHIPGASNLCWNLALESLEEPTVRNEAELRGLFEAAGARPGDLVVTYCRTGTEASLLYFAAKYLGYDARFYDGSYFEWSRLEELPVQGNWAKQ